MKISTHFFVFALLLSSYCHAATWQGQTASGAYYSIETPPGWRSGDGLVLVNHGFNFEDRLDTSPSLGPNVLRTRMLSQGLALAASSYSQRGWALFGTRTDHRELVAEVRRLAGVPGPIYATGGSLGGLVALQQAEQQAELGQISGVLSLCPPLAGSAIWDQALDIRLSYDQICDNVLGGELSDGQQPFPWLLRPGLVDNGGSDRAYVQVVSAAALCLGLGVNDALQSSGMRNRRERLLRVNRITEPFLPQLLFYSTFALSDLVYDPRKLAGRQPFDNRFVDYGDSGLNNTIRRITADPLARLELAAHFTPTGLVGSAKVLTIATSGDSLVVPENLRALDGKLPSAQWSRALVNESTGSHCGFTDAELLASWDELYAWTRGAAKPTPASLNSRCAVSGSAAECRYGSAEALAPLSTRIRERKLKAPDVDAQVNGDWYSVERPGEGFKVEFLDGGRAVVSWFTYPAVGEASDQLWLTGVGKVIGSGIVVDELYRTSGARFGDSFDPLQVRLSVWGKLRIVLSACGRASMEYSGPSGYGSGTRSLVQLTRQSVPCGSLQVQRGFTGLSGNWYDPNRSGEGLFLTVQNDASAFMVWFTYTPEAAQSWLVSQGNLLDRKLTGALLRPTGTRFGASFRAGDVQVLPFGQSQLSFSSCERATLSYQTPWGSASRELVRLTPARDCHLGDILSSAATGK